MAMHTLFVVALSLIVLLATFAWTTEAHGRHHHREHKKKSIGHGYGRRLGGYGDYNGYGYGKNNEYDDYGYGDSYNSDDSFDGCDDDSYGYGSDYGYGYSPSYGSGYSSYGNGYYPSSYSSYGSRYPSYGNTYEALQANTEAAVSASPKADQQTESVTKAEPTPTEAVTVKITPTTSK